MPGTPKLNKALVNALNIHQYGSRVDTNLLAEDSSIVVKFKGSLAFAEEYCKFMAERIRNGCQEYFPIEGNGSAVFDFNLFPFTLYSEYDNEHVFRKGKWEPSDEEGMVKFVVPASTGVISNLKSHFIISRLQRVSGKMIRELVYNEYSREEAEECVKESVEVVKGSSKYPFSVRFDDEGFMENFIEKYKEGFEWKDNDFSDRWKVDGLSMHAEDLKLEDINKSTRKTQEVIGYFFKTPSSDNQRVRRYKDAISDLVLQLTGIPIASYSRDVYVNQDKVNNGEHFAFTPEVRENGVGKRYLNIEEVNRINDAFGYNLLNDVEGQTSNTSNQGNGVYAFSNKQIALLIPEIIESSVIAKTDNGYGLVVNPNLQHRKSRKHSDLGDDLGRILLPKFYKDGYLDKPGLSKASNYIWQCLSESEFGLDGYDMPELAEFVNQKIKEWRTIEEHQDQNIVIPKDENIVISKAAGFRPSSLAVPSGSKVGGSRSSLSSGNSDSSSRSVSPMPRNSSDSSLSSGLPSMPFFGASCVDDLATAGISAPVQMPTVMEASIETSGKYGQSSQILPSIEITGVADENSKSSEDNKKTPSKPEPPLSEVNSVKVDQPGQAIPKVAELSHVGKVRHEMKEESQKEKPKKKGGCIVM